MAIGLQVRSLEQSDVANYKHFESEMLLQQQTVDSRFEMIQSLIAAVMDKVADQESTSVSSSSNDAMSVMATRVHELEIRVKTNHELDSNQDMLDRLDAIDKRCQSALQEIADRMHGISEHFTEMHVKVSQARTIDNDSKATDKSLMLANIADLKDTIAKLGRLDAPQGTQASPAPEPAPAPASPPAQAQSSPTVQASPRVGPDPWTAPASDPWSGTVARPQSASPAPQATPASTLVTPVAPAAPIDWTMAHPASPPTFVASSVPTSGPPYVAPTFGGPPPMVNWAGLQPAAAAPAAAPVPVVAAFAVPPNVVPVPAVAPFAPVTSSYGIGKSLQKEISYEISRKGTDDLYKFKGSIVDFPAWKKSMVNHFALSSQKYRPLIDNIG